MEKWIYIIAGCNGTGKTTAAYTILPEVLCCREYVNDDEIACGLSPFNPDGVAEQAQQLMQRRIAHLMDRNETFSIEITLIDTSYTGLIQQAQAQGYRIALFFFWLQSPELAILRVEERAKKGGHSIAEPTIRSRYISSYSNLKEVYAPLLDYWVVVDNSDIPCRITESGCRQQAFPVNEDSLLAALHRSEQQMLQEKAQHDGYVVTQTADGNIHHIPARVIQKKERATGSR